MSGCRCSIRPFSAWAASRCPSGRPGCNPAASIPFILVAVAAGQLLAGRSPDWILWLTLLGFALTIAAALALPGRRAAAPPSSAGLLSLIGNRRFCLAVVASGLIQASHALLYGFGTIRWLAAGYDKATIGWLWGEGVVVEI